MALSFEKYGSGAYPFPKDDIDPKEKNEEWAKKWMEAMYSCWRQGKTAVPYSRIAEIDSLRALADSRQDVRQYQEILLDESSEGGEMKGYMNINWDIPAIMPKFLRVVEGMLEQTDHQVVATAVDPTSTDDKESAKLDMQYRMKFKEALSYINKKTIIISSTRVFIKSKTVDIHITTNGIIGLSKSTKHVFADIGIDLSYVRNKHLYRLSTPLHVSVITVTGKLTNEVP